MTDCTLKTINQDLGKQEVYTLKSWIDKKYIEDQEGLCNNPCITALKIVFDKCKDVDYDIEWYMRYRSLSLNSNPDFVKHVLIPLILHVNGESSFLASNTSPEIIKYCLTRIIPTYENIDFKYFSEEKVDFVNNLNSNTGAIEYLIEYLISNENSKLIKLEKIVKSYGARNGTFERLSEKTQHYIISKLEDQTLDINCVAHIPDNCIVDIILKNISKIDFNGNICHNTNIRLQDILLKNIEKLDMSKFYTNSSDGAVDFIAENLNKISFKDWMNILNFNKNPKVVEILKSLNYSAPNKFFYYRLLRRCGTFDPTTFDWENCYDLNLIEKNLEYIPDKSILPWYIICTYPEIFEVSNHKVKDHYDITHHYQQSLEILQTKSMFRNRW